MSLMLCACAARYQLADSDIADAQEEEQGIGALYVYPSNRTISLYYRSRGDFTRVGREIDKQSDRDKLKLILTRNTAGVIVGEDLLNGARLLYVSFDRKCSEPECAYGFVQTEDGRYRLNHVPDREGYDIPRVHRDCVLKKRKMKKGNMKALSEANTVFRLKRKRRRKKVKTVFLEVKINPKKRTRIKREKESGRPDARLPGAPAATASIDVAAPGIDLCRRADVPTVDAM